ncbi:BioD-like phosphotransacetylase family protein [Desulfohalotomaculum tongense]|uniref:phosphotransacetylase family protein n=1 Tax=Desulforadius tongensis TaxID=1216062 RepID=UPI001959A787|nr:DRTGG domain-containing protein [Desulforadius tongensis]MBM7854408.1 BioD-like phosphotransacetylase family protein [Desulforadius tongensis]
MQNLYITGTAGSAKTAMAVGLALKLQQEGYKVSYFKPVGITTATGYTVDEDGLLMQKVLGINHPIETIVPCTTSPFYLTRYHQNDEIQEKIINAFNEIAADADVVIIDGAIFPHAMASMNLDDAALAQRFDAAVLHMIKIKNDFSLDQAILFNRYFQCRGLTVLGNVFYNVPRQILAKTEGVYKAILGENGFNTLGIVPHRSELTAPTVEQYYQVLGGEILTGEDKLDRPVEDSVVGAMTIESALAYLRRAPNKAVITGGDRADIALAALETDTSVLILTGGLYPDVKVIAKASEKGVPVILVHQDTFATIERMTEVSNRIKPENKENIKMAVENVEQYINWQLIINSLK